MAKYVAFLRAINVGGHTVRMERLRALFEELGLSGVETFIASGNVIFDHQGESAAEIERRIEAYLLISLGYEVATFLRTPAELVVALAACPFDAAVASAAGHSIFVAFTRDEIEPAVTERLAALGDADNAFTVVGRNFYWLRKKSMRETKITGATLERALGRRPTTMRNIPTVQKLAAKYGPR